MRGDRKLYEARLIGSSSTLKEWRVWCPRVCGRSTMWRPTATKLILDLEKHITFQHGDQVNAHDQATQTIMSIKEKENIPT